MPQLVAFTRTCFWSNWSRGSEIQVLQVCSTMRPRKKVPCFRFFLTPHICDAPTCSFHQNLFLVKLVEWLRDPGPPSVLDFTSITCARLQQLMLVQPGYRPASSGNSLLLIRACSTAARCSSSCCRSATIDHPAPGWRRSRVCSTVAGTNAHAAEAWQLVPWDNGVLGWRSWVVKGPLGAAQPGLCQWGALEGCLAPCGPKGWPQGSSR